MILNPQPVSENSTECMPAWHAVELRQRQTATHWWTIAQPDHAALAGDLARGIRSHLLPSLDNDVIAAIALHDEGWRPIDAAGPRVEHGRPLSFFEIPPHDFLRAWRDSIERAQEAAPIGGILVSEHFCRLGRAALSRDLKPDEQRLAELFLQEENVRQNGLRARQARTAEEISILVDVLQFCDLLSLYLCSGSRQAVVFPQQFSGVEMTLSRVGELCRTDPPLFGEGLSVGVQAREYPGSTDTCFAFLLA